MSNVILQSEAAECGLACLAMILHSHGHQTDLITLRESYPQSLKGLNLLKLIDIASDLKLNSRALKVELSELSQVKTPCILHWGMNHFVVLHKVRKGTFFIHDPSLGERKFKLAEISKFFTGVILELEPSHEFKPKKDVVELKLRQFFFGMKGLRAIITQLFVLSVILQFFALASPYYMKIVLDDVIVSYDLNLLNILALIFGFLVIFNVTIIALRSATVIHLGASINQQLAFNLFKHLVHLPIDYFEKRHVGDIVSRFGSLDSIKQLLTTGLISATIDGLMAISTLAMILIFSPKLSILVIIAMLLYLVVRLGWYEQLRKKTEEVIVTNAKENTNFIESLRGIQTIKLFGIEPNREAKWQNLYINSLNAGIKVERFNVAYSLFNDFLFGIENVVVIYLGVMLVLEPNSEFTIGMLVAFIAFKGQLTNRFTSLVDNLIQIRMVGLHLHRIADIALSKKEETSTSGDFIEISGGIKVTNLSYRYSKDEPYLLKNVNFEFRQGESIAITGKSGSGKTTFIKLLVGLFEPEEGEVLIDEIPLKKMNKRNFRSQIATVMQSDELLSGTIIENVSLGDFHADIEKVKKCCELSSISDEIEGFPMGYNTIIGDMGSTLSGGQKQRILLARALYKDPKILFLDEATSHLDLENERKVNNAVKTLDILRIIIAHRPETINAADRVVELKYGSLYEINDV